MKGFLHLAVVVGFAFGLLDLDGKAQDASINAKKVDEKRLQGTWIVIKCKVNGEEKKLIEDLPLEFIVTGNHFKLKVEEKVYDEGTFTLDPLQKPKAMDVTRTDEEFKSLSIYELKKDELWMVGARGGETKRPVDFTCKKDSHHTLMVFKRRR